MVLLKRAMLTINVGMPAIFFSFYYIYYYLLRGTLVDVLTTDLGVAILTHEGFSS